MNERKMRLDFKKILEDTNKISGQIRAQLGANPEAIAKAVTLAKSFGMELEDVKNISSSLLDFESSIGKELEAELLIGKELNLERARLFALTGDYEGLMREMNGEIGDFYEFSKLNVLQQQALAGAFGMSSDQLSDMLLKEADLESMKQQALADNDEETYQKLTQLDIQEKFNKAIIKLKELFVEQIEPKLRGFVDFLGTGKDAADKISKIFKTGINAAITVMGVGLGLRIGQMITLNTLAASQLALQAGIAGAKSESSKMGLTFGASAVITIAAIMAGVMGAKAMMGSLTSFDVGGQVANTGVAMVHEGEKIIPAKRVPGTEMGLGEQMQQNIPSQQINEKQNIDMMAKFDQLIEAQNNVQPIDVTVNNVTSEFEKGDPMFDQSPTITTGFA